MTDIQNFKLKLMFEWGGGTLWANDDRTREKFGFGPIEGVLPISTCLLDKLGEMQVWHDTALNWEYPPDPSPWTPEQFDKFEKAAASIKQKIEKELGHNFELEYQTLGSL